MFIIFLCSVGFGGFPTNRWDKAEAVGEPRAVSALVTRIQQGGSGWDQDAFWCKHAWWNPQQRNSRGRSRFRLERKKSVCDMYAYLCGSRGEERGHTTRDVAVNSELQSIYLFIYCMKINSVLFQGNGSRLATVTFPNSFSKTAILVLFYCGQCHVGSPPNLHLQNRSEQELPGCVNCLS